MPAETEETYDINKSIARQDEYCRAHKLPHFAPVDGICWACGRNIYDKDGISTKRASKEFITGCPHCHRSYCD